MAATTSSENQTKLKKMKITATVISILLLIAVIGAACTLYSPEKDSPASHLTATDSTSSTQFHTTSKSIQVMCDSTDYKQTCVSSLTNAVAKNNTDPKELVKSAVAVILDEITAAGKHIRIVAGKDPRLQGALEDCRQLFEDSKDEIKRSVGDIAAVSIDGIPEKSRDIRTWLSAVMSYQETCVDGFPAGEMKVRLRKVVESVKEVTSNSLAIVREFSGFLEMLDVPGLSNSGRKLLGEVEEEFDDEGVPWWVNEENRRVLKEVKVKLKANVTVAKDGTGDYDTISKALSNIPTKYKGRYVIYVKEGVYKETVNVTKKMQNITIYGDGGTKTIITGNKNFVDGVRTFLTATFVVSGDNFMGIGLGIRNTAGAVKHQAVAIRVQSDRSIFFQCRFEGYQDTLYAQSKRQFYRSCVIAGTIDFIFGDSAAVFQNCLILIRRPLDNQHNIVLAHGRVDRHETTGFVLHKCRIAGADELVAGKTEIRSYLGRPWKEYARHVIMESEIGGVIEAEGYVAWEGEFGLRTLFYGEFNNSGKGAKFEGRVKWKGVRLLKEKGVPRFTVAGFIQGNLWINEKIRGLIIPVRYGLYNNYG